MMIPITRIERYINEIVGNGDTAPDQPIIRKEIFYAAIIGEVPTIPTPVTNEEKYLSAIANNYTDELPQPVTRIEKFIARAAGMDVTIPTPITREEMFWADYALIVEKELSGIPPLTFKAKKAGTLKNYRIYGQTVDGESVGDRTGNLFDGNFLQGYWAYADGVWTKINTWIATKKIPCKSSTTYTFSFNQASRWYGFVWFDFSGNYISANNQQNSSSIQYRSYSTISPPNAAYMAINIAGYPDYSATISPNDITDFMLVESSTPLPYEPYGYKVPVTVSNGTDTLTTPIYLPEPIKMVGDEAEYIDYAEQKLVKKFYEITLSFDDMNNAEKFPGWSGGDDLATYCDSIRSVATDTPSSYIPMQSSSISRFTARFNVNGGKAVLWLGSSTSIGYTQSELKELYAGQSITFILAVPDTEADIVLPVVPIPAGTNTLSVGTAVQPSGIEIKGRIQEVTP